MKLNVVYCCEERPVSANTGNPSAVLCCQLPSCWGRSGPVHGGGSLQATSPNPCFAVRICGNAKEDGVWCSLELLVLSLQALEFVSCSVLSSDQTTKQKEVDSSLPVYVSLMLFEELVYRGASLTLLIYHT